MAEGRDIALVTMMVLGLLVVAQATTYVVGDGNGWTNSISGWERDKIFKAGDVLVFKYPKMLHNVAVVNNEGYNGCVIKPNDAKVYTSGNDRITLVKGLNNFICSFPRHCETGMKIRISAS